jgi:Ni/Fe-hydrogenase b-type cytochrome subunit
MERSAEGSRAWVYRYPVVVRLSHWVNVLCLGLLVMSGLQIFNAHPALYWGHDSDFERPLVSIGAYRDAEGRPMGVTRILGASFDTTGVLGWSRVNGRPTPRAFPAWVTIPSVQDLATGRVWHFFFAWAFLVNGCIYAGFAVVSRYASRTLLPRLKEWRTLSSTIRNHIFLRVRHEDQASYNLLQKLAYLGVALGLAPLVVLTGLTMSPAIDAAVPWLVDVFGGRQSARTLHFVGTVLFVVFVIVHVVMVLLTGAMNNLRSMITGWYGVDKAA